MDNEQIPSNAEIKEIAALAELQVIRDARVAELEILLKQAVAELREIAEVALPNALIQAGVSALTLPSGKKVTLKEDIYTSIPKDYRYHEALDWLREHGLGDVIKNTITLDFARGEDEAATRLIQKLTDYGLHPVQNMGVHPQTLKALVKEQMAKGVDMPHELFGIGSIQKAVVK
jgi:hypothetical protein